MYIYKNKKPPRHPDEVEKILIFKVYNSNMKSFAKIFKIWNFKNYIIKIMSEKILFGYLIYNNIFFLR